MSVLWTVAASQSLHGPDYLASFLKSGLQKRHVNVVRDQWVCGDEDVRPRNQYANQVACQSSEKTPLAASCRRPRAR